MVEITDETRRALAAEHCAHLGHTLDTILVMGSNDPVRLLCSRCGRSWHVGAGMDAERLAQLFHESYERLAPGFGYETRPESATSWDRVPEPNRSLMIAVAGEVLETMATGALGR